ncbi:FAD linked oxidase, C-terminal domain [Bartonella apihabitans]|nr:FAD linked oxidase, C-terminal domain [Bartonella apihabitans]
MINTDACGQGSCTYGKTRHHVLELDAILMDGTELKSHSIPNDQLEALCEHDDRIGRIYQIASNIAKTRQNDIQKYFPKLNRSLTGYDLAHLIEEDERFNLNSILCGSEGSLAFLVEAKLNVLPIPKYAVLINISYTSFMAALRDAQTLMTHHPISIETVDARVLGLAMQDNIWRDVAEWFPEFKQKTEGINLVEFNGDNINEVDAKVAAFIKALEQDGNQERLGSTIAKGQKNVTAIYTMRKKQSVYLVIWKVKHVHNLLLRIQQYRRKSWLIILRIFALFWIVTICNTACLVMLMPVFYMCALLLI